jgi:hypothetical protein
MKTLKEDNSRDIEKLEDEIKNIKEQREKILKEKEDSYSNTVKDIFIID